MICYLVKILLAILCAFADNLVTICFWLNYYHSVSHFVYFFFVDNQFLILCSFYYSEKQSFKVATGITQAFWFIIALFLADIDFIPVLLMS